MNKVQVKSIPSKVKTAIIVSASIIAVVAIIVVGIQFVGSFMSKNKSIVVYKKGTDTVVRIGDVEKNISDLTATGFKCDKEAGRVFYTVESSYSDGLFDLYFIEKKRSEITEPKIIDIGIREDYDIVSGNVYYLKKNVSAGAFEGYVCDIEQNELKAFSGNVENIYAICSESVYFTKMHGNNRVLYKYNGVDTSEISRDISNIICYNKTENPHIIYEKKSSVNQAATELFVGYIDSTPEMICDNTHYVMYDNYSPNGNLYYFTSSSQNVSWSYVIADQYSETDPLIEKPVRDNFFAILGISEEYNKAFKEYQGKLIRDEIRAALNESVENGDFSVPVFNAFAYNENGSFMIAENIDPKNVYTVSSFGDPKIIYESTEVLPSETDMSTLVEIAQRSEMRDVISYARNIVETSVKSKGMAYSAYGKNGVVTSLLDGYNKANTLFSFSRSGNRLFAFVRESKGERLNLYTNSISGNLLPSDGIGIDTGISSYSFTDDSVIYLKSDINKISGDIYNYNGEENVKLSNAANAFKVENHKDVIILKNYDSTSSIQTADYYFSNEGEEILIGSGVIVDSFDYCENGNAVYVSADNELYIFSGKSSSAIDSGVNEILLFA